ncbi:MAG: sugar ABC transporter ATP-binding protein [Bacillota bacterium]|nr:sugar ABC transporter ATP-binding protein [Bacillota bacterium]
MRGITKRFPGCTALKRVDFSVEKGEVHALVGENGAGKSTLMKVLTGMPREEGEILLEGKSVAITDCREAQRLGISLVPQEMSLAPALSVAENVYMGRLPSRRLSCLVDFRALSENAKRLTAQLGFGYDVRAKLGDLSLANQQLVAIAKALTANPKIIVMDEPTSALTQREVERLFEVIRSLKAQGISVIYISHVLEEVFRIADRITVLRDGEHIGTVKTTESNKLEIIQMMVGRKLETLFPKVAADVGEPVLEVRNLSVKGRLHDVNLAVRRGEIVGIAGLLGSGRSELLRAIFGGDLKTSGEVFVDGRKVEVKCPADGIRHGISLVPEDRKEQGLHLAMNVRENICMVRSFRGKLGRFGFSNVAREETVSRRYVERLGIRLASLKQPVGSLSGGNQQKAVLGKWLTVQPKVLLLDEPTRGIDVGAKAAIHALMSELAGQGMGIVMASSELPEILGMSDRILVMSKGRLVGEVARAEATQERLMALMTGGGADDVAG